MSAAIITTPLPDAPYRGVEPFRFTDQQIFAARTEETWTLLSNVTLYRAVLLYGASGTGKSSLINAGFLPQILKENQIPDRLRVQPFAGREIKVERIRITGNEEQAAYLPSSFAPADSNTSAESIELSLADFKARLEKFRLAPASAESGDLFRAPRATPRPLLIFDQFEEFITLFEEAQRMDTNETGGGAKVALAAQADILQTLVELIQDETLPVKIIFAFREDYLAKLSLLFEYCPELLDQAQRLVPPNIEALPNIIRAPFTNPELRAHFLKQGNTFSEISESLAQEIAAELSRLSEGDNANLTELQIVCQLLWHAPDAEQLFANDGIEGLLKSYGTDVFLNFTPDLRDAAVVLLSHMITASNTRNIISEEDLLSRTTDCDFQPAQCTRALTALSQSQIVRREPRHSIYFYEITSEYLVPWIKERVAERKSAEQQRAAAAARLKLEEERSVAVARFEAEQRRGRVMKILLMVMVVLGVAVVILGWIGLKQYWGLQAAEADTTAKKEQLERVQTAIRLINSQDQDEVLKGIGEVDTLIKENKLPPDLKSVLIAPALTSTDQRVRDAASQVLALAVKTDNNLAQHVDQTAQQLPPRFFIHIADESQRPQAQQLANFLKKQGYLVPGIQNVGEKGVRNNQLRYFRDSDPGIPSPQEILALLNRANAGKWILNRVRGFEQSTKITVGQFELWFASPAGADSGSDTSTTGTLVVNLIDADDGTPIKEAQLTVRNTVDKKEIPSSKMRQTLEAGNYEVTVQGVDGYKEAWDRPVTIKAGESTTLTIKLERRVKPAIPDRAQQRPRRN
jgi:hypothetical protein